MKYLIIITYLCCTCLSSVAQVCVQDFVFTTQIELDAFASNNPDCTTIDGSVTLIDTTLGSVIVDLSPLHQIDYITGNLEIRYCNQLLELQNLNSNLKIDGDIIISDNLQMQYIDLNIYTALTSNIEIARNPNLVTFSGGHGVDSIHNIRIFENQSLQLVEGFEGLDYLQGELTFLNNENLLNIPSFNNPRYIHNIRIDGNHKLEKIDGFNQLDSMFNLYTIGLDSVTVMKGFNNVKKAGGIIINGEIIGEIDVFQNLETAGAVGIDGIIQEEPITIFNKLTSIRNSLVIINIIGGQFNSFLNIEEVCMNHIDILWCNFENLDFLSSMKRMKGYKPYFRIISNPNLSDISGLDSIDADSIHWFNIRYNPKLSRCHSDLVCAVLERGDNDPPSVWMENGEGCNSTEEILEQCADKPTEPTDPSLCPINSRPGMQIDRVEDDRYNIMYHYGSKRMYLTDVAYAELLDLIAYHKVEKDLLFDFAAFTLERYCERAEDISRGTHYTPVLPDDVFVQYQKEAVMSEIDFFSNFVLTIGTGECVKI